MQVAVPSRERIPEYERLRHEVSDLVGEVNGEFGRPEWTPVVYMRRGISRSELVALYAAADVGWVTPLRDGMNLVAKEYVACHRGRDGALLLSEFAGAAAEMGEAFLVNPYDEERTAATLERILELPAEDRQERMALLYRRVQRNNVYRWAERFLAMLDHAAAGRVTVSDTPRGAARRGGGGRVPAPRRSGSSCSTTTARWCPSRAARARRSRPRTCSRCWPRWPRSPG